MKREHEIYMQEFEAWMEEQRLRAEEIKRSIEISDKIKECNIKQLKLLEEKTNLTIEAHNEWAKENGYKEGELEYVRYEDTHETTSNCGITAKEFVLNELAERGIKGVRKQLDRLIEDDLQSKVKRSATVQNYEDIKKLIEWRNKVSDQNADIGEILERYKFDIKVL